MSENLSSDLSGLERQFLQEIERDLDEPTRQGVQACALPVRLEPELACRILQSPLVGGNGNTQALLGRIRRLPFTFRFPDGTFRFSPPARLYFKEQWQNGRRRDYEALNRLIADYFKEKQELLPPEKENGDGLRASTYFLAEAYHRLAAEPQQALEDLGYFVARSRRPSARGEAWAARNICDDRRDFIDQDSLEGLVIPAKYHYLSGDFAAARPLLEKICSRFPDEDPEHLPVGDKQQFIYALASHLLGAMLVRRGKAAAALDLLQRSLAVGRALKAWVHVAMTLNTLGNAYLQRRGKGDFQQAIAHLQESASLARQVDDKPQLAMTLNTLSKAYLWNDQPEKALPCLDEGLAALGDLEAHRTRAAAYNLMGQAYERLGDDRAIEAYENAAKFDRLAGKPGSAGNMQRRADRLRLRKAPKGN